MNTTPIRALASGMLALAMMASAQAAQVVIAPDRMAEVDGARLFILGLYDYPEEDTVLEQVAQAGFNLVQAQADAAQLDRLRDKGLHAWINLGSRIDLSEAADSRAEQLGDLVAMLGAHPALLTWEVPDEALWNAWYSAILWRGGEEPDLLRQRIDALTDAAVAVPLRAELEQVEALHRRGAYAASEARADALWAQLGEASPKPGLGLANAQERAAALCDGLLAGYNRLKQIDPHHPIWMNHAPRNSIVQLAAFGHAADVAGCDIYPVPQRSEVKHSDLADQTLAAVGAYTERMQASVPGKPVWMVLQGFGWADIQPDRPEAERDLLRRPAFAESRFMAYDAIVRGARGILYWGTHAVEKDSAFWRELLTLIKELSGLQTVLSAPDAALPTGVTVASTYGSVDRGIVVLGKDAAGGPWFIVVNEWTSPLSFTLEGLDALDGRRYTAHGGEGSASVSGGRLAWTLPGQEVVVLRPE